MVIQWCCDILVNGHWAIHAQFGNQRGIPTRNILIQEWLLLTWPFWVIEPVVTVLSLVAASNEQFNKHPLVKNQWQMKLDTSADK